MDLSGQGKQFNINIALITRQLIRVPKNVRRGFVAWIKAYNLNPTRPPPGTHFIVLAGHPPSTIVAKHCDSGPWHPIKQRETKVELNNNKTGDAVADSCAAMLLLLLLLLQQSAHH